MNGLAEKQLFIKLQFLLSLWLWRKKGGKKNLLLRAALAAGLHRITERSWDHYSQRRTLLSSVLRSLLQTHTHTHALAPWGVERKKDGERERADVCVPACPCTGEMCGRLSVCELHLTPGMVWKCFKKKKITEARLCALCNLTPLAAASCILENVMMEGWFEAVLNKSFCLRYFLDKRSTQHKNQTKFIICTCPADTAPPGRRHVRARLCWSVRYRKLCSSHPAKALLQYAKMFPG